ncbi:hypothetical protein HanXRQr2_Chr16g0731581 [Helianthus annuus]|uniref:Uncharacterized protein n=1 Tax=Helianthus annuus TaxID=4232 RepID=A0A9K3DNM7_HELAN|nr:hypothetical protein HanXRQr2_Chr16g0731531 [Helianthus annuus]KAF5758646.1 hypothetical protein HanXRQr2_Chr16g0731581 [Helianthus annuus]KAJ0436953.1 hypothetical protein HanHA300_Chr16g0596421 [Helianthus annuus]KAJ0459265.1 hypothetical protein HanHA89_Chr16g0646911 [Helianthus annuus]KAJ0459270.1 hypothetical protein HanHA89_Chr16g0646961 [Helianthus annuus]
MPLGHLLQMEVRRCMNQGGYCGSFDLSGEIPKSFGQVNKPHHLRFIKQHVFFFFFFFFARYLWN